MAVKVRTQPCAQLSSMVDACGAELLRLAQDGARFAFITSDNVDRVNSPLGRLMREYPERCVDVGIAEGNQVGVAAGLALGGEQVVFCKGFGIFLSLRAADQINVDIGYNHVPVRLIADHCGITAVGGPTHNMVTDLALLRAIPGLTIVAPADASEAAKLIRCSMTWPGPMYIRLTKGLDPLIYDEPDVPFELGKAITLRDGADVTLIGAGISVSWVLQAAQLLEKQGVCVRVLNMHTIKPLDEQAVMAAARETGGIVTVEDHGRIGGLGTAVAQCLIEKGVNAPLRMVGFPDKYLSPEPMEDVYRRCGLTPEAIAEQALSLIRNKEETTR